MATITAIALAASAAAGIAGTAYSVSESRKNKKAMKAANAQSKKDAAGSNLAKAIGGQAVGGMPSTAAITDNSVSSAMKGIGTTLGTYATAVDIMNKSNKQLEMDTTQQQIAAAGLGVQLTGNAKTDAASIKQAATARATQLEDAAGVDRATAKERNAMAKYIENMGSQALPLSTGRGGANDPMELYGPAGPVSVVP